jgi:hypothetical protein
MIDQQTWEGVQSLVDNYVRLESDDVVVLVYAPDSCQPAAWVDVALGMRGVEVRHVSMTPLKDAGFLDRLQAVVPDPANISGRLVVMSFERDTMSHDSVIRKVLARYDEGRCAVFRAISAGRNLFADALRISPLDLSARNTALLERFMGAERLRINTAGGTSLDIGLSTKHRWISNRGMWRAGHFVILPAGEVATFPASIEGILVADFAFNVNAMTERDARLHNHPVRVRIENGQAVEYTCEDNEIMNFLREAFQTHCAHNVGELGFGTNPGVQIADELNSHVNERRPGVHIGFGQHNQGINFGYRCNIHLDLIAQGGLVWVDDDTIPIDLEAVTPSSGAHPTNSRDEDVFSPELSDIEVDDCCGILTSEGLRPFPLSWSE